MSEPGEELVLDVGPPACWEAFEAAIQEADKAIAKALLPEHLVRAPYSTSAAYCATWQVEFLRRLPRFASVAATRRVWGEWRPDQWDFQTEWWPRESVRVYRDGKWPWLRWH